MELAHPAGAESLAPQPSQLAHFPVRLIQRVPRVTRGLDHASRIHPTCAPKRPKSDKPDFGWSIFLRKNAFAKKMDCRVKPGNDGSGIEASGKCFSRPCADHVRASSGPAWTLFALGFVDAVPIRRWRMTAESLDTLGIGVVERADAETFGSLAAKLDGRQRLRPILLAVIP
jgi:hypothetical protein